MAFIDKLHRHIYRVKRKGIYLFNKRRSYALDRLDLKLDAYLNMERGFFVEVGANNGIRQSNTLFFERYRHWHGLLIEPIPDLAKECRKNRPKAIVENYALVSSDFSEDYIDMEYCNLMSTVKNSQNALVTDIHIDIGKHYLKNNEKVYPIKVPVMTLSQILLKHSVRRVDLLSLDVEGYEAQALKGINFDMHRPEFMLIEVRKLDEIEQIIGHIYKQTAILTITDTYSDILYKLR